MACNNIMGPRISFSNDFGDTKMIKNHESYREAPVSSDFEFSVPNFSSNSADDIFFNGKMLPLKEKVMKNTLRDELIIAHDNDNDGDGDGDGGLDLPKNNSGWWREKFGLGKSQLRKSQKKSCDHFKSFGGLETIDEAKKPVFVNGVYSPGSYEQGERN